MPATAIAMPARLSVRPSRVIRFMHSTEATTIPAAIGAKPVTAARSGLSPSPRCRNRETA